MVILITLILFYLVVIISIITHTDPWDYFDYKRWRSVSIWLAKLYLKSQGETTTYLDRTQIFNYGYRFSKCYPCVIAGKCIKCNCNIEGRFNNFTDTCSDDKFGEALSKEEIDEYFFNPNNKFEITVKES